MYLLLGETVPFDADGTGGLKDRVQAGRQGLVVTTGKDFGFDPKKWHDYLAENSAEYRWSNKHLSMPKRITKALNDPEWQEVVHELNS